MEAPITLVQSVYLTDGDRTARVDVELPRGCYPSKKMIDMAIMVAIEKAKGDYDGNWFVMDRPTFVAAIAELLTGEPVTIKDISPKWALPYSTEPS